MCCEKNLRPAQQREHVEVLQVVYGVSERRVCGVLSFRRSTCRYSSVADGQAALRIRLRDLAQARVSYGYRRLHILLQREGWQVNHKRVYRLYREDGLQMRPRKPDGVQAHGAGGGHGTELRLVYGLDERRAL